MWVRGGAQTEVGGVVVFKVRWCVLVVVEVSDELLRGGSPSRGKLGEWRHAGRLLQVLLLRRSARKV